MTTKVNNLPEGSSITKVRWWQNIPCRYVFLAESSFTVFLMTYMGSISPMSVAAMIKRVTVIGGNDSDLDVCPVESSYNETYNVTSGEFEWNGATQTMVLSGSSIGMLASYLISARLCEVFGVKNIVGYSFLFQGLLDCLQPTFLRVHVWLFIFIVLIKGFCTGVVLPGFNILFVRWLEENERLKIGSFIFSAQILGTLCAMFTAGKIVATFGWQGPFYLNGILSLPYFISWMYLVYDSPNKHPRISEEEKSFLKSSKEIDDRVFLRSNSHFDYWLLGNILILAYTHLYKETIQEFPNMVIPMAPWIKIIINLPFWAHISVNLSVAWINFTIGTELPLYLTKVLNYNIEQTSVISALPHPAQLASNVLCALSSQWIRNKGYLSKLICYKVFNVIATFGPAIMMCTVPQLGCSHVSIIAVLSMAMFFNGAYYGGSFLNHLDLSENYAGSTAAFASTLSGIVSFCAPLLANIITNENTLTAWNTVFYISAAVTSIPVIIYLFFGSVEEQSWNKIKNNDKSENDITKDIERNN